MTERYWAYVADSARWDGFVHRENDIVVCAPAKSGTTWMTQLVGLLLFDGELPAPLATLAPWVDMRIRSRDELEALLDAQTHRRFLKTHVPLDGLPLDDRATYLVVGRDPRDAWLSMRDHNRNIRAERVVELVGEPLPETSEYDGTPDPLEDPAGAFVAQLRMPRNQWYTDARPAHVLHHLHTGWVRRSTPNVALFHYLDLVRDLPAQLGRLATLLGIEVSDGQLDRYVAQASLDMMRSAPGTAPDSHLDVWKDQTAFFARGRVGEWRTALTSEAKEAYVTRLGELYEDEEFLSWVHGGWSGGANWRS